MISKIGLLLVLALAAVTVQAAKQEKDVTQLQIGVKVSL